MSTRAEVDGVLVQWGERLFYPRNRIVRSSTPRLSGIGQRAATIRQRIQAAVCRIRKPEKRGAIGCNAEAMQARRFKRPQGLPGPLKKRTRFDHALRDTWLCRRI